MESICVRSTTQKEDDANTTNKENLKRHSIKIISFCVILVILKITIVFFCFVKSTFCFVVEQKTESQKNRVSERMSTCGGCGEEIDDVVLARVWHDMASRIIWRATIAATTLATAAKCTKATTTTPIVAIAIERANVDDLCRL
jgi:hypothetical protein